MSTFLDRMPLSHERDIVHARQRARRIADLLGFDRQDQVRIATAVSEIARNAIRHAHGASIEYEVDGDRAPQVLVVRVADHGPGIADLQQILDGRDATSVGAGGGLVAVRLLMDRLDIRSSPAGTTVLMKKQLDPRAAPVAAERAQYVIAELARAAASSPAADPDEHPRELLAALAESRDRQRQLARLTRELEDTNRGVVALYAELDEKAEHLRRADEAKSRFLSNMSHEFRTPLNSIRALCGLLLDCADGPLTDEQARQVTLVRSATEDLSTLVEDLLDIARIEAGKLEVHASEFAVADVFSALRGMLRPLLAGRDVTLKFDEPVDVPALHSDEQKVSQILRNFASNALKFTERGSVTVSVARTGDGSGVEFCVADTGIGIAPEDHERIFEEFIQVRGPLQARYKGTGLGLPLCRRLAQALGGDVRVESAAGAGAQFFVKLPFRYVDAGGPKARSPGASACGAPAGAGLPSALDDVTRPVVLIIEDDATSRYAMRKLLDAADYVVIEASSGEEGLRAAESVRPAAILLDLGLPDVTGPALLHRLRSSPAAGAIPVIVATAGDLTDSERAALESDAFVVLSKRDMLASLVATVGAAADRNTPIAQRAR